MTTWTDFCISIFIWYLYTNTNHTAPEVPCGTTAWLTDRCCCPSRHRDAAACPLPMLAQRTDQHLPTACLQRRFPNALTSHHALTNTWLTEQNLQTLTSLLVISLHNFLLLSFCVFSSFIFQWLNFKWNRNTVLKEELLWCLQLFLPPLCITFSPVYQNFPPCIGSPY